MYAMMLVGNRYLNDRKYFSARNRPGHQVLYSPRPPDHFPKSFFFFPIFEFFASFLAAFWPLFQTRTTFEPMGARSPVFF